VAPETQTLGCIAGSFLNFAGKVASGDPSPGWFVLAEKVTPMDLVTLVTACTLTVDPKLMHALVWHQSGGEPWAISVRSEALPRVYGSMQEATQEMRAGSAGYDTVRVGLAGVPIAPSKIAPGVFLPCRNIAMASKELGKLTERCKAHRRLKFDLTYCAVAVYRGSWEQPDVQFADAVARSMVKGTPDFDMPNNIAAEFFDLASETLASQPDADPSETARALEERKRGWSSALFPTRAPQRAGASNDNTNGKFSADKLPATPTSAVHAAADQLQADNLFVPKSSDRRPQ
jgi:hypothetical protein